MLPKDYFGDIELATGVKLYYRSQQPDLSFAIFLARLFLRSSPEVQLGENGGHREGMKEARRRLEKRDQEREDEAMEGGRARRAASSADESKKAQTATASRADDKQSRGGARQFSREQQSA